MSWTRLADMIWSWLDLLQCLSPTCSTSSVSSALYCFHSVGTQARQERWWTELERLQVVKVVPTRGCGQQPCVCGKYWFRAGGAERGHRQVQQRQVVLWSKLHAVQAKRARECSQREAAQGSVAHHVGLLSRGRVPAGSACARRGIRRLPAHAAGEALGVQEATGHNFLEQQNEAGRFFFEDIAGTWGTASCCDHQIGKHTSLTSRIGVADSRRPESKYVMSVCFWKSYGRHPLYLQ